MAQTIRDVCIIGAGAAGLACAQGLARQGRSVVLLDRLDPLPACFKAEKLNGIGVQALQRLGFTRTLADTLTPLPTVDVFFAERFLGRLRPDPCEAGFLYHELVRSLRAELDRRIHFITGTKVTAVEPGRDQATVVTDAGERIAARLVILATGDARRLLEVLGAALAPQPPFDGFAVAFFVEGDLTGPDGPAASQTYHRPVPDAPIAYATFFRLRGGLRANVFCTGPTSDTWQHDLKERPLAVLAVHNHRLAEAVRAWQIASPVMTRKVAVTRLTPPPVPRVVTLGDAAHVIDPGGGGGLLYALLESELLTQVYIPRWIAGGEFSPAAIQTFYHDARLRTAERKFFGGGQYVRALNQDASLRGQGRRAVFMVRQALDARRAGSVPPDSGAGNGAAWPASAAMLYDYYRPTWEAGPASGPPARTPAATGPGADHPAGSKL